MQLHFHLAHRAVLWPTAVADDKQVTAVSSEFLLGNSRVRLTRSQPRSVQLVTLYDSGRHKLLVWS